MIENPLPKLAVKNSMKAFTKSGNKYSKSNYLASSNNSFLIFKV